MEGLKPPHKSNVYLFAVAAVAFIIGWTFMYKYRPQIVEAGCSNVAARSSNFLQSEEAKSSTFNYEDVKTRCILDVYLQE